MSINWCIDNKLVDFSPPFSLGRGQCFFWKKNIDLNKKQKKSKKTSKNTNIILFYCLFFFHYHSLFLKDIIPSWARLYLKLLLYYIHVHWAIGKVSFCIFVYGIYTAMPSCFYLREIWKFTKKIISNYHWKISNILYYAFRFMKSQNRNVGHVLHNVIIGVVFINYQ